MGAIDMDATLKSFGIDLLDLCEELGVDTINMHASTNERDYFSAVAWRGEEKVADVTWIPRLEEE